MLALRDTTRTAGPVTGTMRASEIGLTIFSMVEVPFVIWPDFPQAAHADRASALDDGFVALANLPMAPVVP